MVKKGRNTNRSMKRVSPPPIDTKVRVTRTYRFESAGTSLATIGVKELGLALGTVCTVVDSTLSGLFISYKIHKIDIWAAPASAGASATVHLNWFDNTGTSQVKELSDTSMNVSVPAHISSKPPQGTLASFWNLTATTTANLFSIQTNDGAIVDIHVSGYLKDAGTAGTSLTVASGTLAVNYWPSLDNGGSDTYTPVGLPTTT